MGSFVERRRRTSPRATVSQTAFAERRRGTSPRATFSSRTCRLAGDDDVDETARNDLHHLHGLADDLRLDRGESERELADLVLGPVGREHGLLLDLPVDLDRVLDGFLDESVLARLR